MTTQSASRLEDFPEAGKVVVAHPSSESVARAISARDGLPYYLHSYVPAHPTHAYVLDMDAIDFIPVLPGSIRC